MSGPAEGEWKVVGPDEPYGDITVQSEEWPGRIIVRFSQDDAPEPEYNRQQWRNAYLMAAAKEFYEAHEPHSEPTGPDFLDWLANRLVEVHGENPNVDFVLALRRKADKARKAIAKAEGRS